MLTSDLFDLPELAELRASYPRQTAMMKVMVSDTRDLSERQRLLYQTDDPTKAIPLVFNTVRSFVKIYADEGQPDAYHWQTFSSELARGLLAYAQNQGLSVESPTQTDVDAYPGRSRLISLRTMTLKHIDSTGIMAPTLARFHGLVSATYDGDASRGMDRGEWLAMLDQFAAHKPTQPVPGYDEQAPIYIARLRAAVEQQFPALPKEHRTMRLNIPNKDLLITRSTDESGVTSIHVGSLGTGPVAELILHPGQDVEVTRDPFVYVHAPGFGCELLLADPAEAAQVPTLAAQNEG